VINIGHVDIEYELLLKNATSKIIIKGKYVNEVKNGNKNIQKLKAQIHSKQIISKFLK